MTTIGTGTPFPPDRDNGDQETLPLPVPGEQQPEPDITEQDTLQLAIVGLHEAMRQSYKALYEFHLAEARRAQAQGDRLATAARVAPNPDTRATLQAFAAELHETARQHFHALLALSNEQRAP